MLNRLGVERSMLTAYFEKNNTSEHVRSILYRDFHVDKEEESTDEIEILDRPLKRSRDEKSYAYEEDLILSRVSNYINSISDTATLE